MSQDGLMNLLHPLTSRLPRLGAAFAQTILPPTCGACDRQVASTGGVCSECWRDIRFLEAPATNEGGTSAYHRCFSAVSYESSAKNMVQAFKFADRTDLGPTIASWMVRAGGGVFTPDNCVIVPVPLHRRRLLERRYNQSAELARMIAKETKRPYLPDTLRRVRATQKQVGLTARQRQANVQSAFRVPESATINVDGRVIVLVDDVVTTGATLEACARALRRAGAGRIEALTFARVLDEGG